MQQEDAAVSVLAYSPPESPRGIPLARLSIASVALSAAHFITLAITMSAAVENDPWGAKGWSAADRVVNVLSFPLLHLAWRFSADSDSVGWGWALLNSAVWGLAIAGILGFALMFRRRLLHDPPMQSVGSASADGIFRGANPTPGRSRTPPHRLD